MTSPKVVVAVGGTNSGNGATFFALALANYLANYKRKKVSFMQLDKSGDMRKLRERIPFFVEEDSEEYFIFQGIKIFLKDYSGNMKEIINEDYDYLLLDIGTLGEEVSEEFIRADRKILICNLAAWKLDDVEKLTEKSFGNLGKEKWILLGKPAYLDEIKRVKKCFGLAVHPLPYIENPFRLKQREIKEIERLA